MKKLNGLTLDNIRAVDELVRSHATYEHDEALKDTWTSYAKEVMAGQDFKGDCDDWASTALHVLQLLGAPKARLTRALVSSTGAAIDHMVGLVEDDDGVTWTIGDTFGPPERVQGDRAGPHKIIQTANVARGTRWAIWKGLPKRETTTAAMTMRTSPEGKDFIKGYEKFVPVAYDDFDPRKRLVASDKIEGTLTIGYGHTGDDVRIGLRITKAQADKLFDSDLQPFEAAIRRAVRVPLTQSQFDALASFVFNCGIGNFAASTLLKKINARASEREIQDQFRRWTRSKGKVMAGLARRRDAEAAMWAGQVVAAASPFEAMFRTPDVSCDNMVAEDKSARRSPDTWLAGGGAAAGGVSVWAAIQDALRDFRDTIYDSDMTLVLSLCGVAMAVIGMVILIKRIKEIRAAQR